MGTRITSKGQVTIPKEVRDRLGLRPGDEVDFVVDVNTHVTRLVKVEVSDQLLRGRLSRGQRAVARAAGAGSANLDMSTDEIMAMMRGNPDEADGV